MAKSVQTDDGTDTKPTREKGYLNPWPTTTRGKLILGYFAGLSILYYFLISTIGTMATRALGVPVLFWLTVLIYVSFAGGMYVLIYRPEVSDSQEVGA